jgi:hypothetical protein
VSREFAILIFLMEPQYLQTRENNYGIGARFEISNLRFKISEPGFKL